jgi:hypothetical protein
MKSIVILVGSMLCLQATSTSRTLSPRELLDARRPLTAAEISSVLAASREALAGKTLRMSAGGIGRGPELLMRGDGQLARFRAHYSSVGGIVPSSGPSTRWTEETTRIIDYTGRPARSCDASPASAASAAGTGELVIEYTWRRRSNESTPPLGWAVVARSRDERDAGMPGLIPVFEMLRGLKNPAGDDIRQSFGNRSARGFAAPFVSIHDERHDERYGRSLLRSMPRQIGDPEPNVAGEPPPRPEPKPVQTLWIDTESLLPLQWEVTDHGRRLQRFDFIYEPLDIRLPAELAPGAAPDCVREPLFRP